jgi:prephenate dehydratase
MTYTIAYLGPAGTYSEEAALAYANALEHQSGQSCQLLPYASIDRAMHAVAAGETDLGVVPVENSIGGSVAMTLDTLWQIDRLHIQQALVLPIFHALLSHGSSLDAIATVYSHPQGLAQCQEWLDEFVPNAQRVPTNSTTQALENLPQELTSAAISSLRAAQIYNLPAIAHPINDYPDNCTRFWVVSLEAGDPSIFKLKNPLQTDATLSISLAFSLPENKPGALVHPLQVLADYGVNLSRIESRPTKRSLGEYLFFLDFEAHGDRDNWEAALTELETHVEVLKILGNYTVLSERSS